MRLSEILFFLFNSEKFSYDMSVLMFVVFRINVPTCLQYTFTNNLLRTFCFQSHFTVVYKQSKLSGFQTRRINRVGFY